MSLSLKDVFGFEADERIVLSVCAVRYGDAWLLRHGTLLIVPEACSSVSWGAWRREHGGGLGAPLGPLPPTLSVAGDNWLIARALLDVTDADRWLSQLIAAAGHDGAAPARLDGVDPVPDLLVSVKPPKALIHALPGTDAAAATLVAGLGRPAQALLWEAGDGPRFAVPQRAEVAGETTFQPALDLAGIHVMSDPWPETQTGALVGRAERRAWIRDARGDGSYEQFLVDLGWDPERISLADLSLTHEELLDGELVLDISVRLEDLDTRAVDHLGVCTLALPTIGRSVAHALVLRTLDGNLLDRTGPHPLVERVHVGLTVNGEELSPIQIGTEEPPPALERRMQRVAEITAELEEIVRNGAQARMIADAQDARDRLIDILTAARDELLVLDRYFGQSGEDWRLLDDVPVPVRVLCAKLEKDHVPTIAPHVRARVRAKAPLHERVYLWTGGGLSVGGSPTTFGQGPTRVTRMRPAEVEEWRAIFEAEWASPLYREVERAT